MKKLLIILFFFLSLTTLLAGTLEIDWEEYATTAAARLAYVSSDNTLTQSQTGSSAELSSTYQFNVAQGFQVSTTDTINKFILYLKYNTGVLSGTLTGYIYSDTGTNEPNAALATFSAIDASTLTSSFVEYTFTGSFVPTASTQYHIVLLWTSGGGGELAAARENGDPYASGRALYNVGGAWTAPGSTPDLYFKLYQTSSLQADSEGTIKTQGSYSLKAVAAITNSLNDTLTKTFSTNHNLTGVKNLRFDAYALRTGSNFKIGLHDTGGVTTEVTPNIVTSNTWQPVNYDFSGVSDVNKDNIDTCTITITNADSANTIILDYHEIAQAIDVFGMVN